MTTNGADHLTHLATISDPVERFEAATRYLESLRALVADVARLREGAVHSAYTDGINYSEFGRQVGLSAARIQAIANGKAAK